MHSNLGRKKKKQYLNSFLGWRRDWIGAAREPAISRSGGEAVGLGRFWKGGEGPGRSGGDAAPASGGDGKWGKF